MCLQGMLFSFTHVRGERWDMEGPQKHPEWCKQTKKDAVCDPTYTRDRASSQSETGNGAVAAQGWEARVTGANTGRLQDFHQER